MSNPPTITDLLLANSLVVELEDGCRNVSIDQIRALANAGYLKQDTRLWIDGVEWRCADVENLLPSIGSWIENVTGQKVLPIVLSVILACFLLTVTLVGVSSCVGNNEQAVKIDKASQAAKLLNQTLCDEEKQHPMSCFSYSNILTQHPEEYNAVREDVIVFYNEINAIDLNSSSYENLSPDIESAFWNYKKSLYSLAIQFEQYTYDQDTQDAKDFFVAVSSLIGFAKHQENWSDKFDNGIKTGQTVQTLVSANYTSQVNKIQGIANDCIVARDRLSSAISYSVR